MKKIMLNISVWLILVALCTTCGPATPETSLATSVSATVTIPPTQTAVPTQNATKVPATTIPLPSKPASTKTATPIALDLMTGTKIAFASFTAVYIMDNDGTHKIQIAQPSSLSSLAFSADGQTVAYADEYQTITVVSADGASTRDLAVPGKGIEGLALSPDGQWLAYMANVDDRHHVNVQSWDDDIFVIATDGSTSFALVQGNGSHEYPAWSPDGKEIAFITHTIENEKIVTRLRIVDVNDRNIRTVGDLSLGWWIYGLSWSSDGRYLAYSQESELGKEIFVMNADGSGLFRATDHTNDLSAPFWLPSNQQLIVREFACQTYCNHQLLILDARTGEVVNVSTEALSIMREAGAQWALWSTHIIKQMEDCTEGWTRLTAGGSARVMGIASDPPNRVRSEPVKADNTIGQIYPGAIVKILEGPVCADGLVYWKVENATIAGGIGWTAEGDGKDYWLEPYQP